MSSADEPFNMQTRKPNLIELTLLIGLGIAFLGLCLLVGYSLLQVANEPIWTPTPALNLPLIASSTPESGLSPTDSAAPDSHFRIYSYAPAFFQRHAAAYWQDRLRLLRQTDRPNMFTQRRWQRTYPTYQLQSDRFLSIRLPRWADRFLLFTREWQLRNLFH